MREKYLIRNKNDFVHPATKNLLDFDYKPYLSGGEGNIDRPTHFKT